MLQNEPYNLLKKRLTIAVACLLLGWHLRQPFMGWTDALAQLIFSIGIVLSLRWVFSACTFFYNGSKS